MADNWRRCSDMLLAECFQSWTNQTPSCFWPCVNTYFTP